MQIPVIRFIVYLRYVVFAYTFLFVGVSPVIFEDVWTFWQFQSKYLWSISGEKHNVDSERIATQ